MISVYKVPSQIKKRGIILLFLLVFFFTIPYMSFSTELRNIIGILSLIILSLSLSLKNNLFILSFPFFIVGGFELLAYSYSPSFLSFFGINTYSIDYLIIYSFLVLILRKNIFIIDYHQIKLKTSPLEKCIIIFLTFALLPAIIHGWGNWSYLSVANSRIQIFFLASLIIPLFINSQKQLYFFLVILILCGFFNNIINIGARVVYGTYQGVGFLGSNAIFSSINFAFLYFLSTSYNISRKQRIRLMIFSIICFSIPLLSLSSTAPTKMTKELSENC